MAYDAATERKIDSALFYYKLGDSLLVGDVASASSTSTETGREVAGHRHESARAPNAPYKLVFEFVDLKGQVVATDTVDVARRRRENPAIRDEATGASIAAWRYKKQ